MIALNSISKSFGNQQVLHNLNLSIETGEKLCIIGKSGSGKSVLLKMIMGLMEMDEGEILIGDRSTSGLDQAGWNAVLEKFGVVFQSSALFDSLSVLENVGIRFFEAGKKSEEEIKGLVSDCLVRVGLDPDDLEKYPGELSGGMKKRVAIARAIIHQPEYVLYDEPTTGLDPVNAGIIDDLIDDIAGKPGITSIIVTHDIDTVARIASKVAMIHEGTVHFVGTKEELFSSNDPVLLEFLRRSRKTIH